MATRLTYDAARSLLLNLSRHPQAAEAQDSKGREVLNALVKDPPAHERPNGTFDPGVVATVLRAEDVAKEGTTAFLDGLSGKQG